MIAGANMALVILMLLIGYSDRLNPAEHPVLSCVGMTFPVLLFFNLLFLFFWVTFKWRYVWIPVLGYVVCFGPISIYMPLHMAPADPPDDAIKLVSYNVCVYGGNLKHDDGFGMVTEWLQNEQPDIACLQEDVDTWRRTAFQTFQKTFAYNDTVHFNTGACINGVGIHTKYPILRRERIQYDSAANGSVAWYLLIKGDTVLVINNHFEGTHLSTEDRDNYRGIIKGDIRGNEAKQESQKLLVTLATSSAKRAPEVECVRRYVEQHSQYPVILCGDFNDNPISYSRHHMAEALKDCFVETGCGLGWSYSQRGFYFRIDHIFCSDDIEPYQCKINKEIDASDHYPIVCWLKMPLKH